MLKNSDVATAFLRKEKKMVHSANLISTGNTLISYNTVIAQWQGSDLIGNATKYSTTSSRHMYYVRKHVDIWTTKPVPMGTQNLMHYL